MLLLLLLLISPNTSDPYNADGSVGPTFVGPLKFACTMELALALLSPALPVAVQDERLFEEAAAMPRRDDDGAGMEGEEEAPEAEDGPSAVLMVPE